MKPEQKLPNPTTNLEVINRCININQFKGAHTEMTIMKQQPSKQRNGKNVGMRIISSRDECFPWFMRIMQYSGIRLILLNDIVLKRRLIGHKKQNSLNKISELIARSETHLNIWQWYAILVLILIKKGWKLG